jgi:hypothetical protein
MLLTVPITGMIGSLDGDRCCPERLDMKRTVTTKIANRTIFNKRALTTTFYAEVRGRS